jgi:hypothetical protein
MTRTREQVAAAICNAQEGRRPPRYCPADALRLAGCRYITPILDSGNAQIYFIGDVERVLASPAYRERLKMGRPPRAKRDRRRRREHRKKGNGGLRRRLNT